MNPAADTTGHLPPALIADIGATNARFALVLDGRVTAERTLRCADFPSPAEAAEHYLESAPAPLRPDRGAFAIASPVTGDLIRMTNLTWEFSISGVRRALGFDRLDVINDFTAAALSVPELAEDERVQVGDGAPVPGAPVGVIGPGTGLGVSALIPGPSGWTALATEGGHVTMAPVSDREGQVLAELRKIYDHVSAERVVSGMGLQNLYTALMLLDGREPEPLDPADISARGLDRSDVYCHEALEMFCAMLGTVAGNLALSLGARGGLYVMGGIVPRLLPFFSHSRFRKRFVEKGRMRDYLGPVPTYIVTHPYPAFLGLTAQLKRTA